MITYVALIRGLGGRYTIAMKDLARLVGKQGGADVTTYIASGNVVFRSRRRDAGVLAGNLTAAIARSRGFAPRVIIRTLAELARAMAANPYPEAAAAPTSLHLVFLADTPRSPDLAALQRLCKPNERFSLGRKVFYFHAPDGVGKSRAFPRIEKALGVRGTARNWRSVCAVRNLAAGLGAMG
jgi:uncharacterized protein (DUF1697 family)